MSSTAAAYGFRPVRKLGGQPWNNSFSQYKIASAYGTNIFKGDVVKLASTAGTVQKDTGTTSLTPLGVFVGCSYTDPNLNYWITRDYWPASTVASDALAFVVDDPDVIFQLQGDGAGTIYDQESIGTNAAVVQGSGSTTTGISGVSLDASSVASTSTLPVKIVGYSQNPANAITDTYADWLVIFNTHFWRTATANAAV